MFLNAKKRGLPVSGKSNPITEYIKMDAVKIECEITKGRSMWEVVPGREAKQDRIFSQIYPP